MGDKETKKRKRLEAYQLAEIIENSEPFRWWGGGIDNGQVLIQLKGITQEDAKELKALGLKFSDKFRWQAGKKSPFKFWFDSASSPRNELTEIDISDLTAFRDKEGIEGRVLLFKTNKQERLFGLAKFGDKYDGIKDILVEPGFFALVIFLKGI